MHCEKSVLKDFTCLKTLPGRINNTYRVSSSIFQRLFLYAPKVLVLKVTVSYVGVIFKWLQNRQGAKKRTNPSICPR